MAQIQSVGAGVLRDHQQFAHPGFDQTPGLVEDLADRAADQIAAQTGDDAEAAAMVAAFRDLQIGIVPRRQPHALRRDETGEGIVRRRQMGMHGGHHLFQRVRAR
jgi:hypothetical protein